MDTAVRPATPLFVATKGRATTSRTWVEPARRLTRSLPHRGGSRIAETEIQKVASALEAHGYEADFARPDLLYVMRTSSNSWITLFSFEPGVVTIRFQDGSEENVNATRSYEDLVREFGDAV